MLCDAQKMFPIPPGRAIGLMFYSILDKVLHCDIDLACRVDTVLFNQEMKE